ncbi:MAG: hypothetical protein ACP5D0_10175 [Hydrogenovibrio sp.]
MSGIRLVGLPGSGKSRFKAAFELAFPQVAMAEYATASSLPLVSQPVRTWCLVDARYLPEDERSQAWLKNLLQVSTGLIFSFADQADLTLWSQWQAWLNNQNVASLPRYRWLSAASLSQWHWEAFDQPVTPAAIGFHEPKWVARDYRFDYAAGEAPLCLEALLFGLDSLRQNLGYSIWRVKGVVRTREYQNPVAIEGQPMAWDTYADELDGIGFLSVYAETLPEEWLDEIVQASLL